MTGDEEIVYWTDGGRAVHKNYRCPGLARAISAEMSFIENLAPGERVFGESIIGNLHSYDFAGYNESDRDYPPDRYMPCKMCYRPRSK